jgi:hypothetical protein
MISRICSETGKTSLTTHPCSTAARRRPVPRARENRKATGQPFLERAHSRTHTSDSQTVGPCAIKRASLGLDLLLLLLLRRLRVRPRSRDQRDGLIHLVERTRAEDQGVLGVTAGHLARRATRRRTSATLVRVLLVRLQVLFVRVCAQTATEQSEIGPGLGGECMPHGKGLLQMLARGTAASEVTPDHKASSVRMEKRRGQTHSRRRSPRVWPAPQRVRPARRRRTAGRRGATASPAPSSAHLHGPPAGHAPWARRSPASRS